MGRPGFREALVAALAAGVLAALTTAGTIGFATAAEAPAATAPTSPTGSIPPPSATTATTTTAPAQPPTTPPTETTAPGASTTTTAPPGPSSSTTRPTSTTRAVRTKTATVAPAAPAGAAPVGPVALALGPAAVVRTQDPPQTGPLDVVTSPQMPSDSLAAAMAELEVLRTAGTSLSAARASLARRASVLEADATRSTRALDRARTGLDRLRAETVRAYLSTSGRAPRASALATARVETLGTAARRALVRRVAAHEHALRAHRRAARRVAASLTVHDRAVLDVTQQVAVLTAKVAAASNEIAPSGAVAPAAPGPTAIARLAVGAARALGTPAPEDDHDARSSLADAVTREADARSDGADAALLVSEWAATPVPALRAVFFGLSQVGKPYVYAAAGPDAYDCSGFTRRAWQEHGIALPHFSGAQLRAGLPVAPEQVRPGDLLAYGPGGAEHVTLAIGAGLDVEAKGRARGVVVDTADVSPSGGRFAGASRPVP